MKKLEGDRLGLIERLRSDSERQLRFRAPEAEAMNAGHYAGVGASLREARERSGLDLFSVATTLRIQPTHLSAIESGEFERLPGPTYAIGFLRTYAAYLGQDGETAVRRFKEETALAPAKSKLVFPEPVEETRRPTLRVVLLALLVAGGVYGGWIYLERHGELEIEAVMEPPRRLLEMLTGSSTPVDSDAAGPVDTAANTGGTDGTMATQPPAMPRDRSVGGSGGLAVQGDVAVPAMAGSADGAGATDRATGIAARSAAALDNKPAPAVDAAPPTRVEVVAVEAARSPAIVTRPAGDAAAGDASVGERAAAADLGSMRDAAADDSRSSATAGQSGQTTAGQATRGQATSGQQVAARTTPETVTPRPGPAAESSGASAPAQPSPTTVASDRAAGAAASPPAVAAEEEESAPAIPQFQANVAPPLPPTLPAAPPPAPVAEATGASDAATGATSADAASERQYRPQSYGAANEPGKVLVRARADSWVQVQGASNELLLTRILRAGDTYFAPNRSDLVLMTGNAGAIEVVVDGSNLGTLGPIGAVRRNIALTPDGLREFIKGRTDRAQ